MKLQQWQKEHSNIETSFMSSLHEQKVVISLNKQQKEIQQVFIDGEKNTLKKLEENYRNAFDEINRKIELLLARRDADMQHVIYQVEYQRAMKKQVSSIIDTLHSNSFESVSEYLTACYEDGFIGTMYDLQKQGVPLVMPIDQKQVVAAIQHDTKLSADLYSALGKDTKDLSKKIAAEISRGISGGQMYSEISRNIASYGGICRNNATRIARTEGHRIQCKATADAQRKAKDKGADIVKQWDASLDGKTRDTHQRLDGQIRELDEPFEIAGKQAMQPGYFGDPAEDCNCRCALLQRAKWALENNAGFTKWSEDAEVLISDDGTTQLVDLSDAKNYNDFKERYRGLSANVGGNGIPEHEEHILLKTIDHSNKAAIINEMVTFEKEAMHETIETACVVTRTGEVYKCFGVKDRVFPDSDLGDLLIGATVSHNHPIDETYYSFSKDDLMLFQSYNLDVLRGCDETYTYEFTRDASNIDETPEVWRDFEEFQHADIIRLAAEQGIGYRRWKNE